MRDVHEKIASLYGDSQKIAEEIRLALASVSTITPSASTPHSSSSSSSSSASKPQSLLQPHNLSVWEISVASHAFVLRRIRNLFYTSSAPTLAILASILAINNNYFYSEKVLSIFLLTTLVASACYMSMFNWMRISSGLEGNISKFMFFRFKSPEAKSISYTILVALILTAPVIALKSSASFMLDIGVPYKIVYFIHIKLALFVRSMGIRRDMILLAYIILTLYLAIRLIPLHIVSLSSERHQNVLETWNKSKGNVWRIISILILCKAPTWVVIFIIIWAAFNLNGNVLGVPISVVLMSCALFPLNLGFAVAGVGLQKLDSVMQVEKKV